MQINGNKIIYATHVVVCDPSCASPEYMKIMAELLEDANAPTMREHARTLRYHNNDGTWGIKQHKGYQPCAIMSA
jgi:hypothetical protein